MQENDDRPRNLLPVSRCSVQPLPHKLTPCVRVESTNDLVQHTIPHLDCLTPLSLSLLSLSHSVDCVRESLSFSPELKARLDGH